MNLKGQVSFGKKPKVVGAFKLAGNLGNVSIESLDISGGSLANAFTVSNPSGDSAAGNVTAGIVTIKDCDIHDYSKSVWYNPKGNKSTPESEMTSVTITGCTVKNCTTGQNVIDIRDGKYGVFTVEKSTFSGCAVSGAEVFRIDDGQNGKVEMGAFVVKDNTFYNCSAASGKALFYVRENLDAYTIANNLFVGTESAAGLFARARVAIGGLVAPTLSGNYFYSMGANIFGEKDDIKEGYGTILETAPCTDPANGNFKLKTALAAGDPRWR